jgi:hypothetical protein
MRVAAAGGTIDDGGVRGWWERADRLRDVDALLAMRDVGIPEGDHVRIVDEAFA